jgi:hypothetical protein
VIVYTDLQSLMSLLDSYPRRGVLDMNFCDSLSVTCKRSVLFSRYCVDHDFKQHVKYDLNSVEVTDFVSLKKPRNNLGCLLMSGP